jgi:outer membrane lipoprotein SlyB
MKKALVILFFAMGLSSCSSLDRIIKDEQTSGAYSSDQTGQLSSVTEGVVVSIKSIKLSGSKGLGTTLGSAIGALAGASTTNKKYNQKAAALAAGVIGAIVGSGIEKISSRSKGYEFLIKTKEGIKAFVDKVNPGLKPGDKVYLIFGNGPVRITKRQ